MNASEVNVVLEKTYMLVVRVVDLGSKPIKDVNVKVLRLEKSITLEEWAENLKNGSPFKRLMLSMNSDNEGNVTAALAEGSYEIQVEKFGLREVCELTQNGQVVFVEPKKHWW